MTLMHWILNEVGEPVSVDLMTWARWSENFQNRVLMKSHVGDVEISTVFLTIDHNFESSGGPILWETMIFGGEHDQYQERYRTKDEALAGHAKALELVRGGTEE